jgi:hypothetical protein
MLYIFFVQIGELKKGLNPPSATDLVFVSPYMGTAIKTGLIIGIIALAVSTIQMPLKSHFLCVHIFFLSQLIMPTKS